MNVQAENGLVLALRPSSNSGFSSFTWFHRSLPECHGDGGQEQGLVLVKAIASRIGDRFQRTKLLQAAPAPVACARPGQGPRVLASLCPVFPNLLLQHTIDREKSIRPRLRGGNQHKTPGVFRMALKHLACTFSARPKLLRRHGSFKICRLASMPGLAQRSNTLHSHLFSSTGR